MASGTHAASKGVRTSYGGVATLPGHSPRLRLGLTGLLWPDGATTAALMRTLASLLNLGAGAVRAARGRRSTLGRHMPWRETQQPMLAAAIRGIFQATSPAEAHQRLVEVVDKLATAAPKVARLLEAAEAELLAFYQLPSEHWSKLRSTNPLERVNREIGRRIDVVGIFPNDAALLRLAGMLLIEQTTSGSSPAATSPRSLSRWCSTPNRRLPPRRSLSSPRPEPPHDDPQLHHKLRPDCWVPGPAPDPSRRG
jgi:hypothetical protein